MNILSNKCYIVQGNWYAPRRKLKEYPSVLLVYYTDQTSSAGDWTGTFIQEINGRRYRIPFWQENNFPKPGFTLYTGDYVREREIEKFEVL
jgi:hypothetical protein